MTSTDTHLQQMALVDLIRQGLAAMRVNDSNLADMAQDLVRLRQGVLLNPGDLPDPDMGDEQSAHPLFDSLKLWDKARSLLEDAAHRDCPLTVTVLAPLYPISLQEAAFCLALGGRCPDEMEVLFPAFGSGFRANPALFRTLFDDPDNDVDLDRMATGVLMELMDEDWAGLHRAEHILDFLHEAGLLPEDLLEDALDLFNQSGTLAPSPGLAWVEQWQLERQLTQSVPGSTTEIPRVKSRL
jgi:hypothetical protein